MIKTAIYLRVSTRDQSIHGYGLDAQETKCKQYLELYEYDSNNVVVYKDDGYSAKDLNRPQLMKLLKDVKQGEINMIVVYKLDRLARSVVDTYSLIQEFQKYECQMVAVIDRLDINSANGRMIVGILAVFAQWEREVIVERTRDGLESMADKGKYPSAGCPFGWKKDDNKYISIDEEQAKIINDLADRSIDGMTLTQLSKYLKDTYGIKKKPEIVKKMLTRELNVGVFTYHDKTYLNTFPPIMSEKKLKRVRNSMRNQSSVNKANYLFYNRVSCSCGTKCDNRLTKKKVGQNIRYYYYYECPVCKKRINQMKLLNDVIVHILFHESKDKLSKSSKEKEKKIYKLRKEIKKIHQDYEDEILDIKTYSDIIQRLNNRIKILNEQIIGLKIKGKNEFFSSTIVQKHTYIQSKVRMIEVNMELQTAINIEWKGDLIK